MHIKIETSNIINGNLCFLLVLRIYHAWKYGIIAKRSFEEQIDL